MTSRRNFPHPVLSPVNQDYQEGYGFSANVRNVRRSEDHRTIVIAVEYQLNEPTLAEMIRRQDARYITLTICPTTRVRDSHPCSEERQEIVLEAARYREELRIESLITTTREIPRFHSPHWAPELREFLPEGARIPSYAILALSNPTITNTEDSQHIESCVTITPSENTPPGEFDVSLDDDLIAISINPGDTPTLQRMRGNEESQKKLWPSMYLTAIERAVREHRDEEHRGKRWTQAVEARIQEAGLEPADNEILKAKSLSIAQKLMEQPLRRIIEDEDE